MRWARAVAGIRIPAATLCVRPSPRPIAAPRGPRFGLACQASTHRREEVATASYGRVLTAIGNSLGKRKRRFDLLPAHGMYTPEMACTGTCISPLRPRFEGAWACGVSKHGVFQACLDARICSPSGQPQTAGYLGQGDAARAPDEGKTPGPQYVKAHIRRRHG
jgi:hypothetical protein